jgi:uncharacterized protein YecE (DUF72 family)
MSDLDREPPMASFVCGTTGWAFRDWIGPFYEPGTAPAAFLETYARHFDAVELDSTFFKLPTPDVVDVWNETTPDGFRFHPKMSGVVTHKRFLEDCRRLVVKFLTVLSPLGEKVGTITFQFPSYARDTGINLDMFLGRLLPFLDSLPEGASYAIEVRNRDFLRAALTEALAARGVPLVFVDVPGMPLPPGWRSLENGATADHVPIHLVGDRAAIEKTTSTWGETVVDQEPRLTRWAEVIRGLLDTGKSVSAFVHNHYSGFAPEAARKLAELVEKRGQ